MQLLNYKIPYELTSIKLNGLELRTYKNILIVYCSGVRFLIGGAESYNLDEIKVFICNVCNSLRIINVIL